MPDHFAVRKWPSSWRKIITKRAAMIVSHPIPAYTPSATTPTISRPSRHPAPTTSPRGSPVGMGAGSSLRVVSVTG
ncbi:MAG: hypothetical protein ABL966_03450 [Acidimicrobiales bacterium]